jgi:hypothetical protein
MFALDSIMDDIGTHSILKTLENSMKSPKTGSVLLQDFLPTIQKIWQDLIDRTSQCVHSIFESVIKSFLSW